MLWKIGLWPQLFTPSLEWDSVSIPRFPVTWKHPLWRANTHTARLARGQWKGSGHEVRFRMCFRSLVCVHAHLPLTRRPRPTQLPAPWLLFPVSGGLCPDTHWGSFRSVLQLRLLLRPFPTDFELHDFALQTPPQPHCPPSPFPA